MGWVELSFCVGLRINWIHDKKQLKEIVDNYAKDSDNLCVISLQTNFKGTEMGDLTETEREDMENDFGFRTEKTHEYMVCKKTVIDESNGVVMDTNRCYGGGHVEYFSGNFEELTEKDISILKQIAKTLNMEYKLSYSMRNRG